MTPEKLDTLRARYAEGGGGDATDPDFRRAAEFVFRDGDKRPPPYAGISTFLGAPYRPEAPDLPDFGGLDIALIGVPMDLGVTNRSGARLGPRAVRNIERIGPYEHVLRMIPFAEARVADVGDLPLGSRFDLAACHDDIEAFMDRVAGAGVTPVSVGGDHSITAPILKALGRGRPVGMVHIDAHCDTGGSFEGCKFHHGGPFRRAVLDGVLDPERTIQIGIRGNSGYLWQFSYDAGMTVVHAEDVARDGVEAVVARARAVVGDGPTYVSFDVDSLDPAFAPGTGTPEAGGLTTREALALLRGLAGIDVVGGDVVEVAPQYDPTSNTAQAAAQVLLEILCLSTLAIARRRGVPTV